MINEILLASALALTPTPKHQERVFVGDYSNNYYKITEVWSFYGKKKVEILANLGVQGEEVVLEFKYKYDNTIYAIDFHDSNYYSLNNVFNEVDYNGRVYYTGFDLQELSDYYDYMIIQPIRGTNEICIGLDRNDYDYMSSDFTPYDCAWNCSIYLPFNISFGADYPYIVVDAKSMIKELYYPLLTDSLKEYTRVLGNAYNEEVERLKTEIETLKNEYNGTINDLLAKIETLEGERVLNNVFDMLGTGFNAVVNFMSLEIAPHITIGMLFAIPIVAGALFFVIKILVK